MTRLLLVLVSVLAFCACGDDVLVTGVDPSPSPSPSPTPDPCKILRSDIVLFVKGHPAFALALGQVATLELHPTFQGSDPVMTAQCPQWDVVTWAQLHTGDPICIYQGNLTSDSIRLVCATPGWALIEATPQGYEEFRANFRFRVLEPES